MKDRKKSTYTWIGLMMAACLMFSESCDKKSDNNPPPDPSPVKGTVMDIEGNVYQTVRLGTQWWMAENLRTTKFSDGSSIPLVVDSSLWNSLTSPGYCLYNNNDSLKNIYGALYNWHAVNSRKLAPAGWHIPDETEWATLIYNLGGGNIAGGKMKSTGTIHNGSGLWFEPNTGATNSSLMSVLPGGFRFTNGYYYNLSHYAFFWSASKENDTCAWTHYLLYNSPFVGRFANNLKIGFSVRCVKN